MKIIFEYENPDYKFVQNTSINQYNSQYNQKNQLNQHKMQNVIGRKNVLLSQIQESKIDPNQEPNVTRNFYKPRINKSGYGNSFNQSQNDSFYKRTGQSMNRGNTTLGGTGISKDVFRTLMININIDRIVFGYVSFCNFRIISPIMPTPRKMPNGIMWTCPILSINPIWAKIRSSSRGP